jgi:hypothetical protein
MALVQVFRSFMKNVSNNNTMNTQIGRWCIPNSPKYFTKSTLIMDRSNEDHCGTCGDNIFFNKAITPEINELIEEDIYYYPYTM